MNGRLIQTQKSKIAMAAGIAAIGLLGLTTMAGTPAKNAAPYLPLNVHVGEKAPDFALPSADGGIVKLSQFAGHNVLLDFYEGYW
jgi:cytochrome oxidase Cu insertion factor (SCO1/SenC/PrrC family)